LLKYAEFPVRKYYKWKNRYGLPNKHNAPIPKKHWLEEWERQAIVAYYFEHPLDGYRRLSFMMLDDDIVAVSPSTVYRVLTNAGLLNHQEGKSNKGTGFKQPLNPHQHWHIDVSYINICGTFYYLCSVLDGCSRYIVDWVIDESMKETQIEILLEQCKEQFPEARPRIISDNGPQFMAKDFKEFVKISGMTHVRTSPFYPQSNGKIERWHGSIKRECIRPKTPLSLEEARTVIADFIKHYNEVRLHSSIGYIPPLVRLEGRQEFIFEGRKEKLSKAQLERIQKAA
jgi:transposase InsO family protein